MFEKDVGERMRKNGKECARAREGERERERETKEFSDRSRPSRSKPRVSCKNRSTSVTVVRDI